MFKPLTGTLKHGLAALIILTAGAGAALPTEDNSEDTSEDTSEDSSDNDVNAPIWTDSFTDLPTARDEPTDTSTAKNQFLAGEDMKLPAAVGLFRPLTLGNAQYDNHAIGGNTASGVGFFTISDPIVEKDEKEQIKSITTTRYHYAGILSGTNLGAPLLTTPRTAKWRGSFETYNMNPTDFVLTVEFGTRKISAFVKDSARSLDVNYYHLTGNYTSAGLITGKVNWGTFSDITARIPTGGRAANGILTGLIGEDGAVGVFVSGDSVDANGKVTGGTGPNTAQGWGSIGYAGGFVAGPNVGNNPNVTFSDWTGSFTSPPSNTLNPVQRRSQFLAGGTSGLNPTDAQDLRDSITLNLSDSTFEGEWLDGQSAFGVSFFYDAETTHFYAGLLRSTNLGAPLRQPRGKLFYYGQFRTIGDNPVNTDFTLEIGFNGKIEAFVKQAGTNYYHLKGTFDGNGVITTGTVDYGAFTNIATRTPSRNSTRTPGILTGLIGMDGAVGVFIAGTGDKNTITGNTAYAGGFVAVPNPPGDRDATTFADWSRSFSAPPSTRLDTETPRHQFLAGGASGLTTAGSYVVKSGSLNIDEIIFEGLTPPRLSFADGSVEFFVGVVKEIKYGYAGLLPSADVGSPSSISATYKGQFSGILFNNHGEAEIVTDFIITTDLTNRTLSFNVANTFNDGVFVARDVAIDGNGVFSGSILHDRFNITGGQSASNAPDTVGSLSGIIGEDGVIGAFYGGVAATNSGFVGGFVARPSDEVSLNLRRVAFSDWVSKNFDLYDPRVSTTTPISIGNDDIAQFTRLNTETRSNQFLAGGGATLDETGAQFVSQRGSLNLSSATHIGRRLWGDSRDGVAFFSNAGNYYAGLLSGTDLGAPLKENAASAEILYKGQFRAIGAGDRTITSDLTIHFNFYAGLNNGNVAYINAWAGRYFLNGTIDRAGVLTGSAKFTPATGTAVRGPLTGLISKNAAVGVFHSGAATGADGFAGGFAALPAVTAATCLQQPWLAYRDFCQDIPLHLNDIPNLGIDLNAQSVSLYTHDRMDISAVCNGSYCNIHYPNSVLNIRPLNDSNTGRVTYKGYAAYAEYQAPYQRSWANLKTHYNDAGARRTCLLHRCTASYSHEEGVYAFESSIEVDFKYNSFKGVVNGNFTDRGIITAATTTFIHTIQGNAPGESATQTAITAPVKGYIGQDTAVMFFGISTSVSHYGVGIPIRRAGGFVGHRVRQ